MLCASLEILKLGHFSILIPLMLLSNLPLTLAISGLIKAYKILYQLYEEYTGFANAQ